MKNVKLCLVAQSVPPQDLHWIVHYLETIGISHVVWPVADGFSSVSDDEIHFLTPDMGKV